MAKKKNNKTLLNEIVAIRESIPDEAKNLQAQLMREKLDNLVISATEFFENEGLDTETENNKESIVKNNKLIPKCLKKYDVILAEVALSDIMLLFSKLMKILFMPCQLLHKQEYLMDLTLLNHEFLQGY